MIVIRNFVNSDIPQLKKYEYGDMSQKDLQELIETWNKKMYNENYFEMFAIADKGVIVGLASLYERSKNIVSCGLEIFQEFRGQGYATYAYDKLLSIAKNKGFTIAVAQVLADNTASIALNKKMGFEAEDYTYINKKGNPIYYFIKCLSE